jgi:hypothetical protein
MNYIDNHKTLQNMSQNDIYNYLASNKNDQSIIREVIHWDGYYQSFLSNELFNRLIKENIVDIYHMYNSLSEEYGNLLEYGILNKDVKLVEITLQAGIDIEKCTRKNVMIEDLFQLLSIENEDDETYEKEMQDNLQIVRLLKEYNFLEKIPKFLYSETDFIDYCQENSEVLELLISSCEMKRNYPKDIHEQNERIQDERIENQEFL